MNTHPKLNVIVIDDSPIQLMIATKLIEKDKRLNLVGTYLNPSLGLRAMNHTKVDMVILDVEMPDMDGFMVKEHIAEGIPIIMNSTKIAFRDRALEAGATEFLEKPLNADKLQGAVAKVCAGNTTAFPAIAV